MFSVPRQGTVAISADRMQAVRGPARWFPLRPICSFSMRHPPARLCTVLSRRALCRPDVLSALKVIVSHDIYERALHERDGPVSPGFPEKEDGLVDRQRDAP